MFFVIAFSHIDIRRKIAAEEVFYLEYFYLTIYLAILWVSINSVLFAMGARIRLIQYRDNLISKLLFWPGLLGLLFAVTVLTTLLAGALQAGVNPFEDPWTIWKGIPFSFTLLLILGCHEMGHWLASRRHGVDVSYVPVDAHGRVDPAVVRAALRPQTVVVSIMHANNEVGTIEPIQEAVRVVKSGDTVYLQADAFGGYDGIYAGKTGGKVIEVK